MAQGNASPCLPSLLLVLINALPQLAWLRDRAGMRQQRGEGWKWHWGIITCYRGCVTPWAAQAPQTWLCFPALLSWWLGAAAELHKLHLVLQSLPCFHQISSVMGLHFCL